jgi:hypothetical protein
MCGEEGVPISDLFTGLCSIQDGLAHIKGWLSAGNPTCLRHPLGFYVALLQRSPDAEWRFHVWPKGQRVITGMRAFVHTHNCHIESRILTGQLTNIAYDVGDASVGGQPLYQVGYSADRYQLETRNWLAYTGRRVLVHSREVDNVELGARYTIDAGDFHEVQVSEDCCTSTQVRMTARSDFPVYVVGLDGNPSRIEFVRTAVDGKELAAFI